jgi:CubicO group peptidase (beta-lactamase class C family)
VTVLACAGLAVAEDAEALRAALKNRVDDAKAGVGMVVGVLTPEGRSYMTYGRVAQGGAEPTAETMFEIGSISKVFTALVLADMVEKGEVAFDDPIQKYLPESVKVPMRNNRAITLADLTTHTSGLPRIPSNLGDPTNLTNPYAKYGSTELYAFLSGYTLTRTPGDTWDYSNLGVGLLGHVLSRRAGMSYEEMVRTRVFEPLGMKNTTITLSAAQRVRMATAHDENLKPVPAWDFDALAGAGAIRSTASDMLTFGAAAMGGATPLKAAFARILTLRRPGQAPQIEQLAGWLALKPLGAEILMHDGGTHGFRSSLMVDSANKRAAIVWINGPQDVNDLAAHAVEPRSPLRMLPAARKELTLDEKTLDSYLGVYVLAPAASFAITRQGGKLFAQLTGQGPAEIFAEKPDEFYYKVVKAELSFTRDAEGVVNGLVLHQNGQNAPATKQK